MRTATSEDCRYCPNPARVAATSGALTIHGVALLVLLIPITAVQIPRLKAPVDPDRIDARIIDEQVVPPIPPPPAHAIVRPQTATPIQVQPQPTGIAAVDTAPSQNVAPASQDTPGLDTPGPIDVAPVASDATVKKRYAPVPPYPLAALRAGIQGEVLVRIRIDRDGVPAEIRIEHSSGNALLDRAALDGVRRWLFEPALRNGVPVEVWATVPVRFSIQHG
jgi:protein TonB